MDSEENFVLGLVLGAAVLALFIIAILPSSAEVTCNYFEKHGYTVAAYENTCMIEVDNVFVPVENFLEK